MTDSTLSRPLNMLPIPLTPEKAREMRSHISFIAADGNKYLSDLVNSQSSPPHDDDDLPAAETPESPLSSPPKRLDPQLERLYAIELGNQDRVVQIPQAERL